MVFPRREIKERWRACVLGLAPHETDGNAMEIWEQDVYWKGSGWIPEGEWRTGQREKQSNRGLS